MIGNKNIDPNQFLIYTPPVATGKNIKQTAITDEKRGVNPEDLNKNLKSMTDFYQRDGANFSAIAAEGEKNIKKAGESLSQMTLAGIQGEKEARVEEKKQVTLSETKKTSDEGSEQKTESAQLRDEYSFDELTALRSKTKDDYGKGLINNKNENLFQHLTEKEKDGTITPEEKHILELASWQRAQDLEGKVKKGKTLSSEESAWLSANQDKYRGKISTEDRDLLTQRSQEFACELVDKKSDSVKPDSIQSDMFFYLALSKKNEPKIDSIGQIREHVFRELSQMVSNKDILGCGLIKEEEALLIMKESEKFTKLYTEAYPDASPQEVFRLVRDNARKLAYQTERDKSVFSGSDHGTRHILEGNMYMADRMIASLGDRLTAKDKVLIHQIIVDHDIGYTVGVAQAKESFDASKDHPLFSTKFVEANKDYYIQKFGEDGYKMIRDGILMHSYPKSEYNSPTDPVKGFNPDMIRSITSTVDALGVTAETKCPAFFRKPEVVTILQKVQLNADTHGGKVSPVDLARYKSELRAIASKETDTFRRNSYFDAIKNQFNPTTVEMTLGQYTGVLNDITFAEKDGKLLPVVDMGISETQAVLGNLFGDQMSTRAFVKAMEDFGVPKSALADMAKKIRDARTPEERLAIIGNLRYESDKAIFRFAPHTTANYEAGDIHKTFEQLEDTSVRGDIRELTESLASPAARTPENISAIITEFRRDIAESHSHETAKEFFDGRFRTARDFKQIQAELQANAGNPAAFDETLKKLQSLTTKREREFMGIKR
ncbi:MAG: hypothetical protein ABRQ37_09945 [Candidatus Eremiobacterota bacterium]